MDSGLALLRARRISPDCQTFVVRHYDGFDNDWIDITGPVDGIEAMRVWDERTNYGARNTSFHDIDYYAIWPSDTTMRFSEQGRKDGAS